VFLGLVVSDAGQSNLFKVAGTLGLVGDLANMLHRWQQQADQDANDGDDDQQFDKREAEARKRRSAVPHGCLHTNLSCTPRLCAASGLNVAATFQLADRLRCRHVP
jgi:hypothetical protein